MNETGRPQDFPLSNPRADRVRKVAQLAGRPARLKRREFLAEGPQAVREALVLHRKKIAAGEDDTLHVMDGDAGMVPRQQKIAHELELIDRWGKSLTVIAIVFGLIVGGLFVYQGWLNASSYMAH